MESYRIEGQRTGSFAMHFSWPLAGSKPSERKDAELTRAWIGSPRLVVLLAAAIAALVLAGCGGGAGQQGGGQAGGGNNLVVGIDQEPAILNQCIVGGDLLVTGDVTSGIQESPLKIMPDLSFKPWLAEQMPEVVSEDPLVIQYRLKEGLTWSDGKPLTSEDAKWTYEQIMDPDNQIITRLGWEDIEKFETPDERTVRMTFSKPFAPWRTLLGGSCTQIFPKHVYEGKDFNKDLNNEIVGSGPYKFKEWKKGQSLTVVRNDNYWGEKPAIDEITYRFIPDTNSLIAALQNGEVSFIHPPPDIGLLEKLQGIEGAKVEYKPGTIWEHIAFNVDKVDNLKMRQAIAYGINREQVVNEILKGQVKPLNSFLVPEQEPYYTPAWEDYTYDPDRARQLVQEAKAEGASTEISFSTTSDNTLRETLQQVVQQQLKDVGITITIDNSSAETFFGERTPQGDFEMGEWAWYANPDPSSTTLFAANQVAPKGQNYYRYRNEEVSALLEQSDETIDEGKRAELLRRAQDLMAQDVPIIPMYQRPDYYAWSENLQGPEVNPSIAGAFWNIGEWSLSN
jgi:peptide/nickel transport system substrate-binding protein